jgi:dephospho-CoA kinase
VSFLLTIGLTGGIGSGKSTVSQWFRTKGVSVIDADKTVHQLLISDSKLIAALIRTFGQEITGEHGEISRSKLGKLVFAEEAARRSLESIVHPRVLEDMEQTREVIQNSGEKVCVWDVPLLFETGFEKYVDQVWVVWVPQDIQIQRVLKRDNLTIREVKSRISAQWMLESKRLRADVVIDNSGTIQRTLLQLDQAWEKIEGIISKR